jgi:hypothetical protein
MRNPVFGGPFDFQEVTDEYPLENEILKRFGIFIVVRLKP